MSIEQLREGLAPVKIPITGATRRDIEAEQAQIDLYRDLYLSAVSEVTKLYLDGILALIANHNDAVPITRTANKDSFIGTLQGIYEDFEGMINDLNGDLWGDLEYGVDEEEDDGEAA